MLLNIFICMSGTFAIEIFCRNFIRLSRIENTIEFRLNARSIFTLQYLGFLFTGGYIKNKPLACILSHWRQDLNNCERVNCKFNNQLHRCTSRVGTIHSSNAYYKYGIAYIKYIQYDISKAKKLTQCIALKEKANSLHD